MTKAKSKPKRVRISRVAGSEAPSASQMSDAEYAAALAQQQQAYMPKNLASKAGPSSSVANAPAANSLADTHTVKRGGGGKKWEDPSLLEWDPSHFRLFVGNLSGEVTTENVHRAFQKYKSLSKAKVVKDKISDKCAGYGFVSFSDADDYFKAFKEMDGKYIGNHPVQLKRAKTEIKAVAKKKTKPYERARPY
ncbi:putative RNA-binding protein [Yarrowia sp. B02]|nr:putative RNA-binding protein [Yarrowia sp. B02]